MYIIKNALRCISRSKGRNFLIAIIVFALSVSACIGLSIIQAAESARTNALEGMSITATISFDRSSMMEQLGGSRGQGGKGGFDRSRFADIMGGTSSLTLDEYKTYAEAEAVEDFYYTLTAYFNGSDSLLPVSDEAEEEEADENSDSDDFLSGLTSMMGGMGMPGGMGFSQGEFTLVGYSSDSAMTDFIDGTSTINEGGEMFEAGTTELDCVISKELALYNDLAVGDSIVITNTALESESYTLKVCGIYTASETNDFSFSMFGGGQDPANSIYLSANALQTIIDKSEAESVTVTDESTGRESESAINGMLSATYVFADSEAYYSFEQQARDLGLGEDYVISSSDINAFESSLTPLETLSTMAGWFLVIILAIGGTVLVVLNIFNVRERKYEVGVLTAMGMKKGKVAAQFMCEILVVTMLAVTVGAIFGAVSSVPVTNALLANQVESQNSQQSQMESNFGRPGSFGGPGGFGGFDGGEMPSDMPSGMPPGTGGFGGSFDELFGSAADYVTKVDSAMNLTVVMQMIGVGLLLTLIASAASVLFIMRYDPLKILANRD